MSKCEVQYDPQMIIYLDLKKTELIIKSIREGGEQTDEDRGRDRQ